MDEYNKLFIDFNYIEELIDKKEDWWVIWINQVASWIKWTRFRRDKKRTELLEDAWSLFWEMYLVKREKMCTAFYTKYKNLWII